MNTTLLNLKKNVLILLLFPVLGFSQLEIPFKMRYQGFVNGDMTVIANNIVNRVDYNNSSNVPYYNHTNSAQLNDEFDMQYIDIDDDEATFSSSSAELFFDNPTNKKILYAGLYWSATYKYNAGIQKKAEKFTVTNPSRDQFRDVKIKLPGQENYINILGEIIFDGLNSKAEKDFAPYAVYADITSFVKELSNPTGVYTVADIKATQGTLSGGSAGGWTLFVVYEDPSMTGKFITSFDGFAGVTDKSTDIQFNGFQTLPKGNVKAKIACAALEGDCNLIGDQLLFNSSNEKREFTTLSNSLRKNSNFFNSCITIENKYFMNRFPDSKNTLGYDTCLITIPNPNNSVIGNNCTEAQLRLKSSGDRYFMFFTAFNVEVTSPNVKEVIVSEPIATNNKSTNSKVEIIKNNVKLIPANNEMIADGSNKSISATNRATFIKGIEGDKTTKALEIQVLNITNQPKGYYIVANVFASDENARLFQNFLGTKGLDSKSFINPINKYKYIYLDKVATETEAVSLYLSKVNGTYEDRIWILSVNNATEIIANED